MVYSLHVSQNPFDAIGRLIQCRCVIPDGWAVRSRGRSCSTNDPMINHVHYTNTKSTISSRVREYVVANETDPVRFVVPRWDARVVAWTFVAPPLNGWLWYCRTVVTVACNKGGDLDWNRKVSRGLHVHSCIPFYVFRHTEGWWAHVRAVSTAVVRVFAGR